MQSERKLMTGADRKTIDVIECLPAAGAAGVNTPLKPFLNMNSFQH